MRNMWILAFLSIIVTAVSATHPDQPYNADSPHQPYHPSPDIHGCNCSCEWNSPVCAGFEDQHLDFPNICSYLTARKKYVTVVCDGECVSQSKRGPESTWNTNECICTREYAPICALVGKVFASFGNKCLYKCAMNQAVKLDYAGTCRDALKYCKSKCPVNIQAVCASNGKTYASNCDVACHRKYENLKGLRVEHQGGCGRKINA